MTTQTAENASTPRTLPAAEQPGVGVQFGRLLTSEWTKLRSVRSTVWTLLSVVVVCVGLGALFCLGAVSRWDRISPEQRANIHAGAASLPLNAIFLGQLVIGVLGVLAMSAEYSSGTIRATLTASPQRALMLVAKTIVFAVVAFVVSLVTSLAAFLIGQAILSRQHVEASLGQPNVWRVVIGGALYLTVVGLLGLGLAAILRHTAAAISTLVGLLLVVTILVNFLPSDWRDNVAKYLPSNAGTAIFQIEPDPGSLAPWTGFALLCGYAALALVLGGVLLHRRDA